MSFYQGIGFENFKVFKNKVYCAFAPITILTGANNSGKSTVINGIKLLQGNFKNVKNCRQAEDIKFENYTKERIDLENIVNRAIGSGVLLEKYGKLDQFINRGSKEEEFTFSFVRVLEDLEEEVDISITIRLNKKNFKYGDIVNVILTSIKTGNPIIELTRSLDEIPSYLSNNRIKINLLYLKNNCLKTELNQFDNIYDFSFLWKYNTLNKSRFKDEILSNYNLPFEESCIKLNEQILKFLSDLNWGGYHSYLYNINSILGNEYRNAQGIGLKKFLEIYSSITPHPGDGTFSFKHLFKVDEIPLQNVINENLIFYNTIFKPFLIFFDKVMRERLATLSGNEQSLFDPYKEIGTSESENLLDEIIINSISNIQSCFSDLSKFEFLSSFKLVSKRVYSFADEDQFSRLIRRLENLSNVSRNNAYNFINRWLLNFGIAEKMEIEQDADTSNFKAYFFKNGHRILIADLGYGTSQILQIILKLIPISDGGNNLKSLKDGRYSSVIMIEEPEANLHPALQSKLADLFVEAMNYGTQLIIETHSEYLIRKLQYLTAKKVILPEFIQLYYFNNPDNIPEGEDQVKKININKDGSLTDNFGAGFYDEADNIALELFLVNKSQNN